MNRTFTGYEQNFYRLKKKIEYRKKTTCTDGITQHALKGQKLLAQGNALGIMSVSNAPCKGKSFKIHLIKMENPLRYVKLFPLQGDRFALIITQGVALG